MRADAEPSRRDARRHRVLGDSAAAIAAILLAACGDGAGGGPDAASQDRDDAGAGGQATPSHVSQAVVDALGGAARAGWEGRLWNVTSGAELPESWIFETPPADSWGGSAAEVEVAEPCDAEDAGDGDCDPDFGLLHCSTDDDCDGGGSCEPLASTVTAPGDDPDSLCVGHSHHAYESFYQLIVEGEELVDVTSLFPPDGPFRAALRNAITYLAHKDAAPLVRLQFASIILDEFDVDELVADLARDVPEDSELVVALATYREGYDSWNHAKIAAADGQEAIVGGMNMSATSYLRDAPVFDLSMHVRGALAADAHRFADELWRFVCEGEFVGETGLIDYAAAPAATVCPRDAGGDIERPEPAGDVWAASLGRLGDIGINAADPAILEAMHAAQDSLKLSIQDLGPIQFGPVEYDSWPAPVLDALATAVAGGVSVDILMTTPDEGGASGEGYSNGWTKRDAIERIEERLRLSPSLLPEGVSPEDAICDHLQVASLRPYDDSVWPGEEYFANHAKSFIVDERAFYIGSQNLYPAELAEFGYLIDDEDAAAELLGSYWDPLWASSEREIDDACG